MQKRKESYMDTFEKLEYEQRNIIISKLEGKAVDYTQLRNAAKEHSEATGTVLSYKGSEKELWRSVTMYLRKVLMNK